MKQVFFVLFAVTVALGAAIGLCELLALHWTSIAGRNDTPQFWNGQW